MKILTKLLRKRHTSSKVAYNSAKLNSAALWASFILPIISVPLAILTPFVTTRHTVSTVDGMLQANTYYDVTLFLIALTVLASTLLWLPLWRRARDRGNVFLGQLLAILFVSGPTLWLYGGIREAALQQMDREFLFAIGAAPGGLPSFGSYQNWSFGPGLPPEIVLALWLLFIAVPAFNYYRHQASERHIFGIHKKRLFI